MVCDHVGDNMFLCHIGEVMVVIEMVVDEYDDRVYKMAKVVTKEWMKFKTAFVLDAEMIQVSYSNNILLPLCLWQCFSASPKKGY